MYQSTRENIRLQNIKLKMYVVIQKSKTLKNMMTIKNIKRYDFF